MGEQDFANKRQFKRISLVLPITFLNKETNQEARGQMRDINEKGVGLVTETPVATGTMLDIWIHMPDGAHLFVKGKVVWAKPGESDQCKVGIYLTEDSLKPLQLANRVMQAFRDIMR